MKKILSLIVTLLIVSVMTYGAFSTVKGDSALMTLGTQATEENAQSIRRALGTDKSIARQYAEWIAALLHGDMGVSLRYRQKVSSLMISAVPVTLLIGGSAFFIAIAVGLVMGVALSYTKGRPASAPQTAACIGERPASAAKDAATCCRSEAACIEGMKGINGALLEGITLLCLSIPEFFLSVIVICIFSLTLHLFIPGATGGGAIFFSAITIALPQEAMLAKFTSAAINKQSSCLYVRTLRGEGASPFRILLLHILPNALVSLAPLAAMMAANIFTGSVIVEQVFGIAGVGRLLVGAILFRDLPLCRALVLSIASVTAILNFMADAAVSALDKRVKL